MTKLVHLPIQATANLSFVTAALLGFCGSRRSPPDSVPRQGRRHRCDRLGRPAAGRRPHQPLVSRPTRNHDRRTIL